MLPKRQRLSRREFEYLLKHGRRIQGTHLSLMVSPPLGGGGATSVVKCAVVVSKKTAKHATARNLLRRRTYAILSGFVGELSGYVAVFTKPNCTILSYQEFNQELADLLKRARPTE